MKKLCLGILLVVLGLPGTAYYLSDMVSLILGALPLLLILGGGLAVYLGYEEARGPDSPVIPKAAPEEKADLPEAGPRFQGNTDTLVFHSISCNFSQGKKCTARFQDRDEAISQGYKPCKICNP